MNKNINILKFFAMISVFCAHLSPVISEKTLFLKTSLLLDSIGALGVGIFFIISGYLYYNNNDSFAQFYRKKRKIFVPWAIIGSAVYFAVNIYSNSVSSYGYITFILGYGSYLYYLLVLNILYLVTFKYKDNRNFLIGTSLLSLVFIILTSYLGISKFSYIFFFNWLLYFNLGILINKYNMCQMLIKISCKYFYLVVISLILIFVLHININYSIGYWSYDGFIIILLFFIFLIGLINKIDLKNNEFIMYIGKNSLSFYLLHMPIAGIVVRITNYLNSWLLIILRPLFVLIITYFIIKICDKIMEIEKLKKFRIVLGLR